MIFLSKLLHGDLIQFLHETDEFMQPIDFRSAEYNNVLLNATCSALDVNMPFGTDSFPIIIDSGASSVATPCKDYFITASHKPLKSATTSGIACGILTVGVGSVVYKIKYDKRNIVDLQINRVLYLEQLPSLLLSPQQIIRKYHNSYHGFHTYRDASKLVFHGCTKTAHYVMQMNLPNLFTESGI